MNRCAGREMCAGAEQQGTKPYLRPACLTHGAEWEQGSSQGRPTVAESRWEEEQFTQNKNKKPTHTNTKPSHHSKPSKQAPTDVKVRRVKLTIM